MKKMMARMVMMIMMLMAMLTLMGQVALAQEEGDEAVEGEAGEAPLTSATPGIAYPEGGWRLNGCKDPEFLQAVDYPASDVNTDPEQCLDNLIRGVLPSVNADEDVATLIVNGTSMPLKLTGTAFERPYSFGIGSNSVEVKSKTAALRRQFIEANALITKPDIRIILSWDTDDTDLDLHVITPDGGHCSYMERALKNGGSLDMDVTTGFGPEIFTMAAPLPGQYGVYVNYYGSGEGSDMTVVKVEVILHESTLDEKRVTRIVPLSREGDLVSVASFTY
jgi:uncharacterized protein YfaP (DUF2135 family)